MRRRVVLELNLLRDKICFNPALFKKYKSIIDDISSTDFDVYSKKGFFHEVIDEQSKIQDMIFKIDMQRWLGMFSEMEGEFLEAKVM